MAGLKPEAPTLMTRAEFTRWVSRKRINVYVWPYAIVPCNCGDHNCHGWRLVPRSIRPIAPISARESMVAEREGR